MDTRTTPRRSGRPSAVLFGLGVVAALAAACGSGSTAPNTGGTAGGGGGYGAGGSGAGSGSGAGDYGAAAPAGGASPASAAVTTRATSLGDVLVGPTGRTVYLFEKDQGTTSSCDGACARAWPAVTSTGMPSASGGATAALLGTTTRSDGTTQVTYAGHPLYYFVGDRAPGDVRGEGLKNFGAGWYVLMPNGQKIDKG